MYVIIEFFLFEEKNVSFLRYLDFCVSVKLKNFKIWKSVTSLLHNGSYIYGCFFWIKSIFKMKLKLKLTSSFVWDRDGKV